MDTRVVLFAAALVAVVLAYLLTQPNGFAEKPTGQGQCLVWHNGDGRYVPIARPCNSAADCQGHISYVKTQMKNMDIEYLVRNYDFSKALCKPYTFAAAFGPDGTPVSCESDEECVKKTAMYTYVRDGKAADSDFDFMRDLGYFKCEGGVCEVTSLMEENNEACMGQGGEYSGCSYFVSN